LERFGGLYSLYLRFFFSKLALAVIQVLQPFCMMVEAPEQSCCMMVEAPEQSFMDRLVLLLYLIPIGVSAGLRALLWALRLPMAGLPFYSPAQEVRWADTMPARSDEDAGVSGARGWDRVPAIMHALAARRAQRIPHAGARAFTAHIAGVANLLRAWEQPADICLVCSPRVRLPSTPDHSICLSDARERH
jgi:hypothetical protein